MASATIFKNFNQPVENKSLIILTKEIREGKYKGEVEKVTSLTTLGRKEEAGNFKKELLAFTPSGTYVGGRKPNFLTFYSGFIVLDLDNLLPDQLAIGFSQASSSPYTFCCFRSPSGNGFKILVEVNSGQEHHESAYKQVADHYEVLLNLPIDRTGKDITRLCFVSYDPDTYRNISNTKFQVLIDGNTILTQPTETATNNSTKTQEDNRYRLAFDMQKQFTQQKINYESGNRNNFIYLLGSNCNRAGIPEQDTLLLCMQDYDLDAKEIKASVHSAYNNHLGEFAKFANTAKLQTDTGSQNPDETEQEDYLKITPCIPEHLYQLMPDIIRKGAEVFSDHRERDVFLTGALGILSGCMPNVKGLYAAQEVYPNLFTFIIAPAASGKGVMKFAKQLGDVYHEHVLNKSREAEEDYNQKEAAFKQAQRQCKKGETLEDKPPVKPPFQVVYVPANTSYAKILSHLDHNEGKGIICETEADTIGNVFKQEWGSYSDMLRKAFHHERLSSSRKTNNEFIEVHTPALSIALSGTPNQVTGLIASAEDGLFSRFIFYAFKVEQVWKDVSPFANQVNLTEHFASLSAQVFDMIKFLQLSDTWITLSKNQWQKLNARCSKWLRDVTVFVGEDAASIVKRLGLMLYRICMLFTAMRKFENAEAVLSIECQDIDFDSAEALIEVYLQHSILMFNNLPKQENNTQFDKGNYKEVFFLALPTIFTRAEAIKLGKSYALSARSVDEVLHNSTPDLLTKTKPGQYQKV